MSSLFNIAAGGSEKDFYNFKINQSLRFNESSEAYLRKTNFSGSPTSNQTGTFSVWVKNTLSYTNNRNAIYGSSTGSKAFVSLAFAGDGQNLDLRTRNTSGTDIIDLIGNAVQRDATAWYHIMSVYDLTNATQADRAQIYVNGVRVDSFSVDTLPNNTTTNYNTGDFLTDMQIGRTNTNASNMLYADFILAEYQRIDGQALDPDSFGETKSGVWIPKEYTGSYGNHGFHLDFADTSDIGKDVSGNGNDFTPNNLSAHDVVSDSPTNNYSVINRLENSDSTLSEGNLKIVTPTSSGDDFGTIKGTFAVNSGKWYWEVYMAAYSDSSHGFLTGIATPELDVDATFLGNTTGGIGYFGNDGNIRANGATSASYGDAYADTDIISVLLNLDDGEISFSKNGTVQNSGTAAVTGLTGFWHPAFSDGSASQNATAIFNFGQDGTFLGNVTAGNNSDGNGHGNFKYAVPSGYLALNTANLPEPSITPLDDDIPEDYFETNLWTGNGSSQSISSYEFAPDWVWIKERNSTSSHYVVDTVRGASLLLQTNSTVGDTSNTVNVTSFDSNGFSLGDGSTTNENNKTYVGWSWLAGTAFTNDASSTGVGTIDSTGQVNTEAGFAIISHTGTGSAGTIAHGLGKKPCWITTKLRSDSGDGWLIYHHGLNGGVTPEQKYVVMSSTSGIQDNSIIWNDTAPTTTVFSVGTSNAVNGNTETYISYVFAEIEGYSKFGFYTGNGSNDGPFVYTGFRPSWIMTKRTNSTSDWVIQDNKRQTVNPSDAWLRANLSNAEGTTSPDLDLDFVSNGFKIRNNGTNSNINSSTYIYMAFAEMPSKYANAR